jgi:transcriptional antiterminator RfaH
MLDAAPPCRLDDPQQDTGRVSHFAPTPSGCRPGNHPLFKIVTERRGGPRPGSGPKPRKPLPVVAFRPGWYVVTAQPKAERTAHASLHRAGYKPYLPLLTVRRPDRSYHTSALFPGYLFVRLDLARPWYPIRYAPGVYGLILTDGIPSLCPEATVEALQATEAMRATPLPATASWAPGMACSVRKGYALEGLPAVITHAATETANIAVMLFGHLRNILVPLDALAPRGET